MKYSLLALLALGLTIGRAHAQERPVLGAPPVVLPAPTAPAPRPPAQPVDATPTAPEIPIYTAPGTQPAQPTVQPEAQPPVTIEPSSSSPSGLELPGREQARKAAQQHAEQYTRFFIYSGFGLGYSSYGGISQFSGSLSPALGIRLTDRISVGPGLSYSYNNYGFGNYYGGGPTTHISTNNIGVKVFGQVRVINQFFVHAEYETTRAQLLEQDPNGNLTGRTVSRTVQTPLAGVGYRSQISNRAAADIVILYNFQDNYSSIYSNPVIRFNFLFNIGK
ncbi:hypothetical protein [Hymenobacter coccineus]|uniref:Outer membrane protein beta-barrel domain-containing protein n=1 Tax=Hymenobacter coccineus TaxID=1908235 RepID=A0A1G1SS10_9BACT|nr:hypothetical protein [Hymenobacter coccineus]OGX81377.1 hypothetical protein BEN49_15530 [Hymenobacter coccineus]